MRYLRNYKLFENLESEINLELLEDILIDFTHMDLKHDIQFGSSSVLDFDKLNKERELNNNTPMSITSDIIDSYIKFTTYNSITIDFYKKYKTPVTQPTKINLYDLKDAYDILEGFLFREYKLVPNYIYVRDLSYKNKLKFKYYENFKMLELDKLKNEDEGELKYLKINTISLSFYKK